MNHRVVVKSWLLLSLLLQLANGFSPLSAVRIVGRPSTPPRASSFVLRETAIVDGEEKTVDSNSKALVAITRSVKNSGQSATQRRRWPLVTIIFIVQLKELWSKAPKWIKSSIPLVGRKSRSEGGDDADLTYLKNMSGKMKGLLDLTSTKLDNEQQADIAIAFLVLLQLTRNSQEKTGAQKLRDDIYRQKGRAINFSNATSNEMEGLDELFEFADLAYNQLPNEETLEDALAKRGYTLLRYETPDEPGSASQYLALSIERETVLIGVKGYSGLADILTDCCGHAVSHQLKGPTTPPNSSKTTIRCHKDILTSSLRLFDSLEPMVEDLIIPTRYKILITGHSLGAGVASMLGVLLRARFPQLNDGSFLKVVAFAPPPILDHDTALACYPYCTSVVNNADIIPRASLANVAILMKSLKSITNKLEEQGKKPTNILEVYKLLRDLNNSDEEILSYRDMLSSFDQAFDEVKLRDPDHLYVPGKVIQMYDLWSKGDDGLVEKETAECAHITNGASDILRAIFLDSRLLTDHLAPAYRSSIRCLLDKSLPKERKDALNEEYVL